MYLYRLGCRVLEPFFPTIHPNMDGRRAPRFPKRVFHVARNAIFMVRDTRFRGSRNVPCSRKALSWFPKRAFMVPEERMLRGTRFSWFPTRAFTVPEALPCSRGALSWFPKCAFMVPEKRFHGSLAWFPRSASMVPETRFHGSRNDLSWFPKRPCMVPETTSMVPETAFMVPEMRSWFPKHGSRTDARPRTPQIDGVRLGNEWQLRVKGWLNIPLYYDRCFHGFSIIFIFPIITIKGGGLFVSGLGYCGQWIRRWCRAWDLEFLAVKGIGLPSPVLHVQF